MHMQERQHGSNLGQLHLGMGHRSLGSGDKQVVMLASLRNPPSCAPFAARRVRHQPLDGQDLSHLIDSTEWTLTAEA